MRTDWTRDRNRRDWLMEVYLHDPVEITQGNVSHQLKSPMTGRLNIVQLVSHRRRGATLIEVAQDGLRAQLIDVARLLMSISAAAVHRYL